MWGQKTKKKNQLLYFPEVFLPLECHFEAPGLGNVPDSALPKLLRGG